MRWLHPDLPATMSPRRQGITRALWGVFAGVQILSVLGVLLVILLEFWQGHRTVDAIALWICRILVGLTYSTPLLIIFSAFYDRRLTWAGLRFFLIFLVFILVIPMHL
jgi:hypothetical protein